MYKNVLSVVVMGCVMTTPSFASSLFNKIHSHHKIQNQKVLSLKSQSLKQEEPTPHADFSGKWEGTCKGDDWEDTLDFEIFQSEDSLTIGGEFISVDKMLGESYSDEYWFSHEYRKFSWSEDGNTLVIHGASVGTGQHTYPKPPIMTMISTHSLTLKNDTLILKGKDLAFSNDEKVDTFKTRCTFNRVK